MRLDVSDYVSRGIEENPKNFDRRSLYREVSRLADSAILE